MGLWVSRCPPAFLYYCDNLHLAVRPEAAAEAISTVLPMGYINIIVLLYVVRAIESLLIIVVIDIF